MIQSLKTTTVIVDTMAETSGPMPYLTIGDGQEYTTGDRYTVGMSATGTWVYIFVDGKPTRVIALRDLVEKLVRGDA